MQRKLLQRQVTSFSRLTLQVLSVTNISFSPYINYTQIKEKLKCLQKPANAPTFYQISPTNSVRKCVEISAEKLSGAPNDCFRENTCSEKQILRRISYYKDDSKLIDDRSITVLFWTLM